MMTISFYCKKCGLDQDLLAIKSGNRYGDWFEAKCRKCSSKLKRYITGKEHDPYYFESKRVKIDRLKFSRDLIQPGQSGFQTFYRNEWLKMEETNEKLEMAKIKKIKDRNDFYKRLSYDGSNRQVAKKIIEAKEKLEYGGK
jgi:hypothetical protein